MCRARIGAAAMRSPHKPITPGHFDAVLFDLDGVLTSTAKIHSRCWKTMFDDFLGRRSAAGKEPFRPFDIGTDYKLYVDGKPRYEGVRSFLASRNISLSEGIGLWHGPHPGDRVRVLLQVQPRRRRSAGGVPHRRGAEQAGHPDQVRSPTTPPAPTRRTSSVTALNEAWTASSAMGSVSSSPTSARSWTISGSGATSRSARSGAASSNVCAGTCSST